jgi:hypothetical protein
MQDAQARNKDPYASDSSDSLYEGAEKKYDSYVVFSLPSPSPLYLLGSLDGLKFFLTRRKGMETIPMNRSSSDEKQPLY